MRRPYIDWLRGIAVVAMIEWHVIDSWAVRDGRETVAWDVIKTIGGFAAPLFLFLAGVAVPLAIDARIRRGVPPAEASWSVQKRGWQVFGIAHLFRLQSFLLNPNARWSGILKPDILNILGLGLAWTAWLCGHARNPSRVSFSGKKIPGLILWLLAPAVMVLLLTPYSRIWWWPTLLYNRFEAYIRPVGNFGVFSLFPWVALVPFGAYIGSLLIEARDDASERRVLGRFAAFGLIAAGAGVAGFWVPAESRAAFWVGPYCDMLLKAGVMTAAVAGSKWLVRRQPAWLLSPVLLLGQTSLFVYWVHVEIAYGVWSYPLHYALPLSWAIFGFVAVLVAMYYAGKWWAGLPAKRVWIPAALRAELATRNSQPTT